MYRHVTIAACTLLTIGMLAVLRPGTVDAQKKVTDILDVNRPGVEPYHGMVLIELSGNNSGTNGFAPEGIPADKRLVIEFVSARVSMPLGQKGFVEVNDLLAGASFGYAIPLTVEETTAQFEGSVGNQLTRLYVDGFGGGAGASFRRDSVGGTAYCAVRISGYLIDK